MNSPFFENLTMRAFELAPWPYPSDKPHLELNQPGTEILAEEVRMAKIETRERMRRLIGLWRASGKKKAEFVRGQGVSRGKLEYWVRRLGEPRPGRRSRRREALSLVPVQVTGTTRAQQAEIEILLATGDRVRVRADVPAETLGQVVRVLRQGC